jgi:hypothetical protein
MNQAFFVPFFAAVALEAALVWLRRWLATRHALVTATAVIVAVAALAVGGQGYNQANAALRFSYGGSDTPVTPASESAFSWLREHTGRDDTVINETVDGSTWMYAEAHVIPLIGVQPGGGNIGVGLSLLTPDLRDRNYLIRHFDLLGTDERVDALVRHFHARWIYYGEATFFPYFPHALRLPALLGNPYIREVFRRSRIHVFRIDLPPGSP